MATIDRYVSETAGINAKRSMFPMSRRVLTSYFHGYLQPIGVPIEVLPGDTWKAKVAALIRMSTPLRPIMDNVRFELDCFFVPKRVIFGKTKLFYGEADTFGIAEKIDEPYMTFGDSAQDVFMYRESFNDNITASETFAAAFGLICEDIPGKSGDMHYLPIQILPIRAYLSVYNQYYRDQNYQDQYKWDMDATGLVDEYAFLGKTPVFAESFLPKVNKDKDLFISILPWQQKGDPVMLGIGDKAPIVFDPQANPKQDLYQEGKPLQTFSGPLMSSNEGIPETAEWLTSSNFDPVRLSLDVSKQHYADLSNAAALTINNLLYALAYQDFLTRAGHYGTKYKEYVYSMFGTTIADATEDIPEYLGRMKFNININQVLSTMDQDAGLGEMGAYSVTGGNKDLFTSSFTEPGYLVFVGYCKHQRTYSSGIDKVFLKHELLDYYQPPFANIGDVPVSSFEIFAGGEEFQLGFQEPFYDYHALQDRVYGILNPLMPHSLANWTLAERFISAPTINARFLEEDRTAFIDALASGDMGPDYIMDFEFKFEVTRVMPLFSTNRLGSL